MDLEIIDEARGEVIHLPEREQARRTVCDLAADMTLFPQLSQEFPDDEVCARIDRERFLAWLLSLDLSPLRRRAIQLAMAGVNLFEQAVKEGRHYNCYDSALRSLGEVLRRQGKLKGFAL